MHVFKPIVLLFVTQLLKIIGTMFRVVQFLRWSHLRIFLLLHWWIVLALKGVPWMLIQCLLVMLIQSLLEGNGWFGLNQVMTGRFVTQLLKIIGTMFRVVQFLRWSHLRIFLLLHWWIVLALKGVPWMLIQCLLVMLIQSLLEGNGWFGLNQVMTGRSCWRVSHTHPCASSWRGHLKYCFSTHVTKSESRTMLFYILYVLFNCFNASFCVF